MNMLQMLKHSVARSTINTRNKESVLLIGRSGFRWIKDARCRRYQDARFQENRKDGCQDRHLIVKVAAHAPFQGGVVVIGDALSSGRIVYTRISSL